MPTTKKTATTTASTSTANKKKATPVRKTATKKPDTMSAEAAPLPSGDQTPAPKPARRKKTSEPTAKKLSALDAAAQVLSTAPEPLNAKELIEAMAEQNLWISPGGATPHATLFAAMMREINTKGTQSRFTKAGPGKFTRTA